jgi:TatD DNase family protein
LFATVGTHPDYEDTPEPTVEQLVELAQHPKILAIGETGLDYYRMGDKTYEEMEWQRERFRTHIRAALKVNKPLIIHTRSASEDTIRILKEEGADQVAGVMHCFSGIVTFKSAKDLQETCKQVPLERMLIETDSPYLAPMPHRGKTNEPAWVSHVAEFVANLKGVTAEELARVTTHNFKTLFKAPI